MRRLPALRPSHRSAALVAALALVGITAGCGGGGGGGNSTAKDCTAPAGGEKVASVEFDALEYKYEPSTASVPAGVVEIKLVDAGQLPHTLVFEECTTDPKLSVQGGGQDSTTLVKLEAGSYTFYCDVPGHRGQGMVGTLTVG